eukprot:c13519_g1_i1.p1 GENE.c13519_g1_i1~~c13519_g1_i1.p1  ORF type:complete len:585 (+),score=178.51 c13519_g1_i1:32-1786(+)
MKRQIYFCLFVLFCSLKNLIALNFCIKGSNEEFYSTYDKLNVSIWNGTITGFCSGLYDQNDLISPISEISCQGEGGSFQSLTYSLGAFNIECLTLISRISCSSSLPLFLNATSQLSLPCTETQKNSSIETPQTLEELVRERCGNYLASFPNSTLISSFSKLDNLFVQSPQMREFCRVVFGDNRDHKSWIPNWKCPKELVKVDITDHDLACQAPCPTPVYSDKQFDLILLILNILNSISFSLLAIVIITWSILKERLIFPRNLIYGQALAIFIFHISFLIGEFNGSHKEIWCLNKYKSADQFHFLCGFQGTLLLYSAKSCVCWWLVILFNCYKMIGRGNSHMDLWITKYILFGFGYPAIAPIIALSTNKIGYSTGAIWCFVSSDLSGTWQYGLFYGDLSILIFIGFCFGVATIILIRRHNEVVKAMNQSFSANNIAVFDRFTMKLGFLMFWVFCQAILTLSFRADISTRDASIRSSIQEWAVCVYRNFMTNNYQEVCTLENLLNYDLLLFSVIISSLDGLLVSLLFGDFKELFSVWKLIFRYTCLRFTKKEDQYLRIEVAQKTRFKLAPSIAKTSITSRSSIHSK